MCACNFFLHVENKNGLVISILQKCKKNMLGLQVLYELTYLSKIILQ